MRVGQNALGTRRFSALETQDKSARIAAVLADLEEHGIETVRVVFVDQHGILRGKTLVAGAMPSAFQTGVGVPSTLLLKDTAHRTVFPVWQPGVQISDLPLAGAGDVILKPDPDRFWRLPWAPHSALILSAVHDRQGTPVAVSSDAVLAQAVNALDAAGYRAVFGLEVEFQVFQRVDAALGHAQATMPPAPVQTQNLTQGHQYLTETRYGEVEDLLDDLRRTAEQLGLEPRSMEIEMGPSQFEFTFAPSDPQTQADRFVLFRTMVKELCHARGLHASFMAKPNLPNAAANGWHIHQSLVETKQGRPALVPDSADVLTDEASAWMAGLLKHASACCLLTNPTVNSYKRFAPFQLAPNRIQWARDNRGAMIRALLTPGDPASRIENRVADSTVNPHFAIAGQIMAGLDGLSAGLVAPDATETPYEGADKLPQSLLAAIEAFENNAFIASRFGEGFQSYLTTLKRAEWDRYLMTVSEWEQQEYFGLF